MKLNRPFQLHDTVQPSERWKKLTPWNPSKRVYGKIVDVQPDYDIETIHVPGSSHPIQRLVEDRSMYTVQWRLPYGDLDTKAHLARDLAHVPPLIALADCADG